MYLIQEIIRYKKSMGNIGFSTVILPVILPKFKSTPNSSVPKCATFQLACAMKSNPGVIKQAVITEI